MPSPSLQKLFKNEKIRFVLCFGSYATQPKQARDVDLAIFSDKPLNFSQTSLLLGALEAFFSKAVDLVQIRTEMNPVLVQEIASKSAIFWLDPKQGLKTYIEWADRALAIAEDELLSYPKKERSTVLKKRLKKLYVT